MTNYGYMRVSTDEQQTDMQLSALRRAGVDAIYSDEGVSGSTTSRPELDALLGALKSGDSVTVYSLSRLGRNLAHLISIVEMFGDRGVDFVSLSESIDTSTAAGRLTFHIFASLATFEREQLRERTRAGMAAAKARGAAVGRPRALSAEQVEHARVLAGNGVPLGKVAASFGCSRATLYRAVNAANDRAEVSA